MDSFGEMKVEPRVITGSRYVNDYMPEHVVELVRDAFNEKEMSVKGKKICILGFAFLENSDDTRNTPALPVFEMLKRLGAEVVVHDVHVKEFEGVVLTNDLEGAVSGADCLVIVIAHSDYQEINPEFLKEKMRTSIVIDGRNVFHGNSFTANGFEFKGVGTGMRE